MQGIVTNATDVKPMLTVATYLDTTTGIEVYQEITGEDKPPQVSCCNMTPSTCRLAGDEVSHSCQHERAVSLPAWLQAVAWGWPAAIISATDLDRLSLCRRADIHAGGAAARQRGAGAGRGGPGHADARLALHEVPGGPHPGAGSRGARATPSRCLEAAHLVATRSLLLSLRSAGTARLASLRSLTTSCAAIWGTTGFR